MDFGLFLLRLVIGGTLIAHGAQKLFGWFGGHGLAGTGAFLEQLGFRPGRVNAALSGLAEAGGGLLLATGFLTPIGAAAVISVMLVAIVSVHGAKGFFSMTGGFEYPLVLAAIAAALAFTGPGAISLDRVLHIAASGSGWGLAAIGAGLISGAAPLLTRRTVPPATERQAA